MNRESSRSHAVFTLVIEATEVVEEEGLTRSRVARFNLVDLAGSERQKDTQVGVSGDGKEGDGGGAEGYSFFACLSRLTIDHASLSRRRGVKGGEGGGLAREGCFR